MRMKRSQRIKRNFAGFRELLGRFREEGATPSSMTYGEVVTHYTYWRQMDRWNRGWDVKPTPISGRVDTHIWWIHRHRKPERLP